MTQYKVETTHETDGRWIAEVPALPGVMVYGSTHDEAVAKVKALTLRVLAEKIEMGELTKDVVTINFVVPPSA